MSDQQHGIDEVYTEVEALKDLFLRRLMEDKVRSATINTLAENNERLSKIINDMHFTSFIKELFLICDRIEANSESNDFDLSIRDELLEIFSRREIWPITDLQFFNPAIHNAIKTIPVSEGMQPGAIVHVQRTGYYQGSKVLRPADVVVVAER